MTTINVPTRNEVSPANQALFDNLKKVQGWVPIGARVSRQSRSRGESYSCVSYMGRSLDGALAWPPITRNLRRQRATFVTALSWPRVRKSTRASGHSHSGFR